MWPVQLFFSMYTSYNYEGMLHRFGSAFSTVFWMGNQPSWLASCITLSLMHMTHQVGRHNSAWSCNQRSRLILSGNLHLAEVCERPTGSFGSHKRKYIRQSHFLHSYCQCEVWHSSCPFITCHSVSRSVIYLNIQNQCYSYIQKQLSSCVLKYVFKKNM